MRLVYKYILNGPITKDKLLSLCKVSKYLYNQALYTVKQSLEKQGNFLFYNDLNKIMQTTYNLEGNINYRLLKAQVAQQCLKSLDKDIKSFINSSKDRAKNKTKYIGKPELPKYKGKVNQLVYTNQCSKISKDWFIYFDRKFKTKIPQWDKYDKKLLNFQQIRVNPLYNGSKLEIEIIYLDNDICNSYVSSNEVASIDLGLNNLITIVTSTGKPIIINGKGIKAYNQLFNKRLAKKKSEVEKVNKHKSSKSIKQLYSDRDNYLNDICHKVSRFVVNYLLKQKIGTLAVGLNKGWKDSISIGKKNNQAFMSISHSRLIDLLRYKCEMVGIKFIVNEESHTSKIELMH